MSYIRQCQCQWHGCQVTGPAPPHTPVKMTPIPPKAWITIGCDLCGPPPTGETLIVCVDYHSRYPDVEIVKKTKTPDINYGNFFPDLGHLKPLSLIMDLSLLTSVLLNS